MNKKSFLTFLCVVPILAACGTASAKVPAATATLAPAQLTIEAKEFSFSPAHTTVKVGQVVNVVLKNTGVTVHDFTIEKIKLADKAVSHGAEHGMGDMMGVDPDTLPVHVAAEEKGEGTVTFIPSEPGEFEFYCTVAGHKAAGMVGKITVVAP